MDKLREDIFKILFPEDIFKILFPSADTARAADLEMIEKIIARVRREDYKLDVSGGTADASRNGWGSHTA